MESNKEVTNVDQKKDQEATAKEGQPEAATEQDAELSTFPISIKTCTDKKNSVQLQVSPMDNIQDIKQYLFESIDTCHITNYHLYINGTKLNDFAEIREIPEIEAKSVLEMVEGVYDERSIRFHIRRLREIMNSAEVSYNTPSPAVFSQVIHDEVDEEKPKENGKEEKKVEQKDKVEIEDVKDSDIPADAGMSLSNYYPAAQKNAIACVKSMTFSGWNPPPGNRKLSGDLVYLEITTLENKTFHITGWSKGFYVNATTATHFNPSASDKPHNSHTLVGLLNSLSPGFKKNFNILLLTAFQRHAFEMFPVPFANYPWVVPREKHSFDLNRAEDALVGTSETEVRGQLRDWNEDFQSARELPNETIQERIVRDRALVKINCDFVEAATKGAVAIVEKTVQPINPLDPEKAHMYIYNNIFFSYAVDGRDFFKEYGGDKAAYVSVNNDLKGIRALNRVDVRGLYTLATAIIDYRGHRVVAQSIIPGILQREQTSNVVYGSIDNGKTIAADSKFHELMIQAGKALHFKENTVKDGEGKEVKICCPVESKGIVGTDSRKYILDLVRFSPRDANYTGKHHAFTILRPELVAAYYESLRMKEEEKEAKEEEQKKAEQKKAEDAKADEKKAEENKVEEKKEVPPVKEEAKEQTEQPEAEPPKKEYNFPAMNPNVLCELALGGTPEEITEDENRVKALTSFLMDTMIPILVDDLSWMLSLPVDGVTLTSMMHAHGVNVRYLGHLTTLADKSSNPVLKELCLREMITRSAKHILRSLLADTEDYLFAGAIAHFFNCLFGYAKSKEEPQQGKKNGKKKTGKIEGALSYSSNSLWEEISADVKERFRYDLPSRDSLKSLLKSYQTVRSLCQKTGVQIEARDYSLDSDTPFGNQNILNLVPVVKHSDPESMDGRGLLDVGKTFLNQGRLDIAYELLTEALAIFHQVYGPMHRDTANCYFNLGTVLYHAKDVQQALDHQQKATVISERVLGLDHHDTAQQYATLALFSHAAGKHKLALNYMNRSLYLTRLVSGPNHPDTATIYVSIATMLQELGQHKLALNYLMEALKSYETLVGTNHIQTATIYHAVAIAYSQLGQFREALIYEKKNYNILHETVGDADLRTVESNICLKQFTAKAVQMQIETKKTQRDITAQLSQVKLDKIRNTVNLQPGKGLLGSGIVNNASTGAMPMGTRPIGEVLSYINGKTSKSSFADRNKKKAASTKKPATKS